MQLALMPRASHLFSGLTGYEAAVMAAGLSIRGMSDYEHQTQNHVERDAGSRRTRCCTRRGPARDPLGFGASGRCGGLIGSGVRTDFLVAEQYRSATCFQVVGRGSPDSDPADLVENADFKSDATEQMREALAWLKRAIEVAQPPTADEARDP